MTTAATSKIAQVATIKYVCDECGKSKSPTDFYNNGRYRHSTCKPCTLLRTKRAKQRLDAWITEHEVVKVLSMKEAVEVSGMSREKLKLLAQSGSIRAVNVGIGKKEAWKFDAASIAAWKNGSLTPTLKAEVGEPIRYYPEHIPKVDPAEGLRTLASMLRGAAMTDDRFERFADYAEGLCE